MPTRNARTLLPVARIARWAAVLAVLLPVAGAQAAATVIDVDPVFDAAAGTQTHWYAVNESGQLAGGVPGAAPNTSRAARWDKGVVTVLGSENTGGKAIADDGTVLGAVLVPHEADYPAWWDATGEHTAVTPRFGNGSGGGGFVDVSHNGTAALNVRASVDPQDGHYIGGYVINPPFSALSGQPIQNADGVTSVNNFGHGLTRQKIFQNGQSQSGPLFLDGATATPVGISVLGYHALNDFDTFVGTVAGSASGPQTPAEQTGAHGPVVPLPLPPGATSGGAEAINDAGLVVGASSVGDGSPASAVIWRPGGVSVATLDSLLPPGSPWHLKSASDISDSGFILGIGTINGGPDHTFLIRGSVNQLSVNLEARTIGDNDVFDLSSTVTHNGDASAPPIPLAFLPAGGLTATAVDGGAVAPLTPIFGPLPAFPAQLTPGQSSTHLFAFGVDGPGTTRLKTEVSGTDAEGTKHRAAASVLVSASYRQPTRQDLDGLVAGSMVKVFDDAIKVRARLVKQFSDRVRARIASDPADKRLLSSSDLEKLMSSKIDVPENGLSWITSTTYAGAPKRPTPMRMIDEVLAQSAIGTADVLGKNLKPIQTSMEYWRDFLFHPDGGSRVKMAMEFARVAGDGAWTAGGYLGTAAKFYTSPAAMTDAWTQLPRMEAELEFKLDGYTTRVGNKIVAWDELMRKDPVKGAGQFGRVLSSIETEVALFWAQNVIGANVTRSLRGFVDARKAAGVTAAGVDGAATTGEVLDEAAAATPVLATPQLGNLPARTVARLQSIAKTVSDQIGVKVELQARPLNALAAKIKGGLGKVEAVPTKNLTPDDVILGAPEKFDGQTAYYEPKYPAEFAEFEAPTRERLKLRFKEKAEELAQFLDPKTDPTGKALKVHKALRPGGVKLKIGKYDAVMELTKTVDEETGAILLRYKKLVVDGKAIFKGAPRAIVSDVDFHAVIDAATGLPLPASIRGKAELLLMREFSKAAKDGDLLFGFHGWTHSGFDLATKDFRYVLKYMLMYLSDADAAKVAAKYSAIYHVPASEFLDGYTKGKLVVKITSDAVTTGAGASGL